MSRDSGADQPTQRTVAELLAEYGGSSEKGSRRRRRKAEDPTETAPQEIINRVLSDSGKMRPVKPDEEPPPSRRQGGPAATPPQAAPASPPPAQPPAAQPPAAPPAAQAPAAQPPAPQPPAAQPPANPPQAAGPVSPPSAPPARPAAEPPAEAGPKPGSAGYWAQRFGSTGSAASNPPAPSAPSGDAEATIRQPALPTPPARSGPPMAPAGPPQLPENFTEQLPRIDGGADQAYPAQAEPNADPYDYESFDDSEQSYSGAYEQPYDEPYDQAYDEDYDSSAPAGLNDDYDPDEADRPPSAGKEWGTLALQGVLGLVGGGAVWVGFRWLWINATIAAFGAALVFTGLLVLVAWKFFRTNDLQTILLSVLVGLFCTVSPAALLLINQ
ncbi:hypothetical protein E1181_00410 [Saccharopolyspora terrae]|uniref:Uncharacterized protein n=1 Tax=Saccharopolyspora terrae TaxID=2530384 RepID=A0A4V2YC90_9PSEU|nr:hypothetical protein [Saccharopolyspora terrae]TDD10536.1 hypothetical protein E1181_00410 [Saccharopolyspora terrae]